MSEVNFGYNGNCLGMDSYRLDLFWDKVNIGDDGDCWNWTAGCDTYGYGQFRFNGSLFRSHRVSFALHHGFVPNGDKPLVCHKCANNRACVNPLHLYAGSHQDNMNDMVADDNTSTGSDHGRAKLTEDQVLEMRRLYATGNWTQQQIANQFGVSRVTVSFIVNRKTWTHI